MECEKINIMMSDALYGELSVKDRAIFESHLSSCEKCNQEFEELKLTLHSVNQRIEPERDAIFWNNYWNKLEDKIEEQNKSENFFQGILKKLRFNLKPALQFGSAIALIVIGVLIGKYGFTDGTELTSDPVIATSNIVNASLQQRTDRYIQRSKVLLLGLVNYETDEEFEDVNFNRQKEISQDLIKEASFLKAEYSDGSKKRLKKLISDLEVILLHIANLEAENDIDGIEMVKSGVDKKGIFLKININEMQNANRSINSENSKTQDKMKI